MPRLKASRGDGSWWVAKESFSGVDDAGDPVIVTRDQTRFRDDDETGARLLAKYPGYFERLETESAPPPVEQATAAPGEKRGQPR
jgi:hypothetical protein